MAFILFMGYLWDISSTGEKTRIEQNNRNNEKNHIQLRKKIFVQIHDCLYNKDAIFVLFSITQGKVNIITIELKLDNL